MKEQKSILEHILTLFILILICGLFTTGIFFAFIKEELFAVIITWIWLGLSALSNFKSNESLRKSMDVFNPLVILVMLVFTGLNIYLLATGGATVFLTVYILMVIVGWTRLVYVAMNY